MMGSARDLNTPVLTHDRRKELVAFQKKSGLRFRKIAFLDLAFCHRSFVNETTEVVESNERLEFLGDSVLGIVVADYLYKILPGRPEGTLARIKSHVVSEESLAEIALSLRLDAVVRVGRGEELSGGRIKKALLADCMEALIGAWYLDSGFDKASKFILRLVKEPVAAVLENKHRRDYKTILQELVQKQFHCYPKYRLLKKTGPDHERTFWINVTVQGETYGPGIGQNKKTAEQEAARLACEALQFS